MLSFLRAQLRNGAYGTTIAAFTLTQAYACAPIVPQTSKLPIPLGRVAFQAYSQNVASYHVYYYDFLHPGIKQIDQNSGLQYAENPSFSSDGNWIVFYGMNSCGALAGGPYYQVYAYNVPYNVLSQLSACDKTHYLDIRFSADMKSVVYKNYFYNSAAKNKIYYLVTRVAILNANGTAALGAPIKTLFGDTTERSWPGLSPSSKYLYYYTGSQSGYHQTVHSYDFATGVDSVIAPLGATPNANAYYATPRDLTSVLYSRPSSASTNNDQIYIREPILDGQVERGMTFNDCNINNSDAAPIDEDYVIYSRPDYPAYLSGNYAYTLFVGQIGATNVWSLTPTLINGNSLNLSNLRGATFWTPRNAAAP